MATVSDTGGLYQRHQVRVDKYLGDDTSGEPEETVVAVVWMDPNGQQVTDPERIAALEAKHQEEHANDPD